MWVVVVVVQVNATSIWRGVVYPLLPNAVGGSWVASLSSMQGVLFGIEWFRRVRQKNWIFF